eukprot:g7900.t1
MLTAGQSHTYRVCDAQFTVRDRYRDLEPVGGGAFGLVVAAQDLCTRKRVAIKKIPRAFQQHGSHTTRVLREIKLLRFLMQQATACDRARGAGAAGQPGCGCGVIEVLDVFGTADGAGAPCDVYLVTDWMESDLEQLIQSRSALTEAHVRFVAFQLMAALAFMHSAGVLHRDLKPSNVLINANCSIKICDFGLARGVPGGGARAHGAGGDNDGHELTQYVVTRWYRAPELLTACASYGAPIDVWAAACIVAELLLGAPLFRAKNYRAQLERILAVVGAPAPAALGFVTQPAARRMVDDLCQAQARARAQVQARATTAPPAGQLRALLPRASAEVVSLLAGMLAFAPQARATVDAALDHAYLAGYGGSRCVMRAAQCFVFDAGAAATGAARMRSPHAPASAGAELCGEL